MSEENNKKKQVYRKIPRK